MNMYETLHLSFQKLSFRKCFKNTAVYFFCSHLVILALLLSATQHIAVTAVKAEESQVVESADTTYEESRFHRQDIRKKKKKSKCNKKKTPKAKKRCKKKNKNANNNSLGQQKITLEHRPAPPLDRLTPEYRLQEGTRIMANSGTVVICKLGASFEPLSSSPSARNLLKGKKKILKRDKCTKVFQLKNKTDSIQTVEITERRTDLISEAASFDICLLPNNTRCLNAVSYDGQFCSGSESCCQDGQDNDFDGKVDCDDPNCCVDDACKDSIACTRQTGASEIRLYEFEAPDLLPQDRSRYTLVAGFFFDRVPEAADGQYCLTADTMGSTDIRAERFNEGEVLVTEAELSNWTDDPNWLEGKVLADISFAVNFNAMENKCLDGTQGCSLASNVKELQDKFSNWTFSVRPRKAGEFRCNSGGT